MPGTDLGPDATWKRPDDVRRFFEKFRGALEEKLGQSVELVVEREKREAGVIHDSMFHEAANADVFIADLTGSNPNVFLELGVRYALRRRVTIPVSQSTKRLPFNIEHMRAVQYANRPDDIAIQSLVELVENGLANPASNDSPILSALDLVSVKRELWERVSGARRDTLLAAADQAADAVRRIQLLREAVESDPQSVTARLELIRALRKSHSYLEALNEINAALAIDAVQAVLFQERGLCLGKLEQHEEAVEALEQAVALEPGNTDVLSSLGGALRRVGMQRAGVDRQDALRRARDCYRRAASLDEYDTYPALNEVRLEILLSGEDATAGERARTRLDVLWHLCAYEAGRKPEDYWRAFDLADTQLLLGRTNDGLDTYRMAVELVPADERKATLSSPFGPLRELLDAGVLRDEARAGVQQAKDLLSRYIDPRPK